MRHALNSTHRAPHYSAWRDAHVNSVARTHGCATSFGGSGVALEASVSVGARATGGPDKEGRCSSGCSARWWSPTRSTAVRAGGMARGLPQGHRVRWSMRIPCRTAPDGPCCLIVLNARGIGEHLSVPGRRPAARTEWSAARREIDSGSGHSNVSQNASSTVTSSTTRSVTCTPTLWRLRRSHSSLPSMRSIGVTPSRVDSL